MPDPDREPGLIRLLIRGNRLSYAQVAERAEIDEALVARLVSGDTGLSERTAEKLAYVLNVHPEVLILATYMERADRRAEKEGR